VRPNKLRNRGNVAATFIRGLHDTNYQPILEGGITMSYEKDARGTTFTKNDPNPGMPAAGTHVTVYTPNGPVPGQIQGGVAVPNNTGKNH
jgi:hypothetical protein